MKTRTPVIQNYDDDGTSLNDINPTIMGTRTYSTPKKQIEGMKINKNNNDEIDDE